jgi:hypothetical protein
MNDGSGFNSLAKTAQAPLPRFTQLAEFDPHRTDFECKHEADANPPTLPEADALFLQAQEVFNRHESTFQGIQSAVGDPNVRKARRRDHREAIPLYEQAMMRGHWEAQFQLAQAYLTGIGIGQDQEKAAELIEDLMGKGVPAAWDLMGSMHMGGAASLKKDMDVAHAFWQKAADMGSMSAQVELGRSLLGDRDDPPWSWANRPVGLKMLECAFEQGSAEAAAALGSALTRTEHQYARALVILHEGVRRGSRDSASMLFIAFSEGHPLVGNQADSARASRYRTLDLHLLFSPPNVRFPNLDEVLPLPPAPLPPWEGSRETMLDTAKAVTPVP